MDIRQAKQEIANTLRAYHRRDEAGNYLFPRLRQRPILLMGPPGIGKTAILEQIAREQGVGLVSYSMTHHTRQSAVGLPRIESRRYGGDEPVSVTEYTLSEIVASVYECMERTGVREGILFIDEINCVSETLVPTMLQFLQNKTFGNHPVPEGWMIVAAGNPAGYNRSVRSFDIVTLDRLRRIDVEPQVEVWLEYARSQNVHGSILSWLSIHPEEFYRVELGEEDSSFVTARGWEDLSALIGGYESLDVPVTEAVIRQYLQHEGAARRFAAYYRLYRSYDMDYSVDVLLATAGELPADKIAMAARGGLDERLSVVHLMASGLNRYFTQYTAVEQRVSDIHEALGNLRSFLNQGTMEQFLTQRREALAVREKTGIVDRAQIRREDALLRRLEEYCLTLTQERIDGADVFPALRQQFEQELAQRQVLIQNTANALERGFAFVEAAFGQGSELILFVSALAHSSAAMEFVRCHGCEPFLRHSEKLLYREQEQQLQESCKNFLSQEGAE